MKRFFYFVVTQKRITLDTLNFLRMSPLNFNFNYPVKILFVFKLLYWKKLFLSLFVSSYNGTMLIYKYTLIYSHYLFDIHIN